MSKVLLLIGKGLISIALLIIVPLFYVFYSFGGHQTALSHTAGRSLWAILPVVALGWGLCLIANKGLTRREHAPASFRATPIMLYFRIIKWSLACAFGFQALVAVLIGIYYIFKYIEFTGPFILAFAIIGKMIYFGVVFFNKAKR